MTQSNANARGECLLMLVLSVLVASYAGTAHANDGFFGGASAQLFPLTQNQVEMRSEEIVATADVERWKIKARYVFFNHDEKALKLRVGFPELRCESGDECHQVAFRNLETKVDGKPVTHREGKLQDHHDWAKYLGTVWLFDVTFPPQKELTIEHSYSLSTGGVAGGFRYTRYVVKTGVGWRGKIGRARFVGRYPPYTHMVAKIHIKGLTTKPPRVASDDWVELVMEGSDWVPKEDVTFMYNALWEGIPNEGAYDCFYESNDWQPEKIRYCRNLLYASKGYGFESKELRKQFYSGNPKFRLGRARYGEQVWLRDLLPLDGFTTDWFERSEWRWLVDVNRTEKELLAKAGDTEGQRAAEKLPAVIEPSATVDDKAPPTKTLAPTVPPPVTPTAPSQPPRPAATKTAAPKGPEVMTDAPRSSSSCVCSLRGGHRAGSTPEGAPLALLALLITIRARRSRDGDPEERP